MIFWSYVIAAIAVLFVPALPISDLLSTYDGSWQRGYLFVLCCLGAFAAAYATQRAITANRHRRASWPSYHKSTPGGHRGLKKAVNPRYLLLLAAWAFVGAAIAVLEVHLSIGFPAWFSLLAKGGQAAEVARGSTIFRDGSQGGLPGYLKILNQNCTASVLILMYLLMSGNRFRGLRARLLVLVIGACFVVRNFIYIDRLALLALLPATVQLWKASSLRAKKTLFVSAACIAMLGQLQSMRRGCEFGPLGFMTLYVQSGMINLNLMIDTLAGPHTHGFATILSPMYWAIKAFGIRIVDASTRFSWIWNDAQDAYGLLFQDFGWFGPLLFLPVGAIASRVDRNTRITARLPDWKLAAKLRTRGLLSYAVLSTMFVPAFAGPEFWLTLVTVTGAAWLEYNHQKFCFATQSGSIEQLASSRRARLPFQWHYYAASECAPARGDG